jgi:ribosomal protein S18 acetylase RimI-like enzyme
MRTIHKATLSDAEALAELAEQTFRDAFETENNRADMDSHCLSSFRRDIQAAEISDPKMATLVCRTGDGLIAYAQMRWERAPPCVSARAPGEIQRIYVAKTWHGAGVAYELMRACMAEMIARKTDVVWLGVWERNPRAIAFYRKLGFAEVGDHIFALGSDKQRDIIMSRPCGAI